MNTEFLENYNDILNGLKQNREFELYYQDKTYGVVTWKNIWQLWEDDKLIAEKSDYIFLLEDKLIKGKSLKEIILSNECGYLIM